MPHLDDAGRSLRRLGQRFSLLHGFGDRFFHQHVNAALQAAHRQRIMRRCGRDQAHGINLIEQVIHLRIKRDFVLARDLLSYLRGRIANAHQLRPPQRRVNAAMTLAHHANADNTHPQAFHVIACLVGYGGWRNLKRPATSPMR